MGKAILVFWFYQEIIKAFPVRHWLYGFHRCFRAGQGSLQISLVRVLIRNGGDFFFTPSDLEFTDDKTYSEFCFSKILLLLLILLKSTEFKKKSF